MASIKDVAKKAGVSISTVSYVLSGERPVSQKTKDLVRHTMDEVGYRPHAVARALASKRTRILALILSPQDRALGITELDLITRASERATELGYHLVLWTLGSNRVEDLEDLAAQGLAEGLILMEVRDQDPCVDWLRRSGLPFQVIGRCREPEGLFYTDIDFRATVSGALDYLESLGHRRVALINQSREAYDSGYGPVVRIHDAFESLCSSKGLEASGLFCGSSPGEGSCVFESLMSQGDDTTALLVMNDGAIPGILDAAGKLGRRIPEDLSILSLVSSSRFSEMAIPALSGMEVPVFELMGHAVESLVDRLEERTGRENGRLWPCRLTIRQSTAGVS